MDSPQLHAVGFDFPTLDDLVAAGFKVGVHGVNTIPGFDLIGHYTDPSGARLAFLKRTDQPADTTAGLASDTAYRAQVVRFTDHLARVTLYANDEEGKLLTQFVSLVDDPIAYAQHDLTKEGEFTIVAYLEVAALAIDVAVYADEAAFEASPAAEMGPVAFGPRDLYSPGLLGLQASAITPQEATPTLLMAMVVQSVDVRRNHLSGVDFQYVIGSSEVDLACAIPMEHPVQPGNVVHGLWYATASSGTWNEQQASDPVGGAE